MERKVWCKNIFAVCNGLIPLAPHAALEGIGTATDTGAVGGGTGQGEGWACIHDEGTSTVIWSILD